MKFKFFTAVVFISATIFTNYKVKGVAPELVPARAEQKLGSTATTRNIVVELTRLSKKTGKRVVSTLDVNSKYDAKILGRTHSSDIEAAKLLHAQVNETPNSILIYHIVPRWFAASAQEGRSSFQKLLGVLTQSLSGTQRTVLEQEGKLYVKSLSPEQKRVAEQLIASYFDDAPIEIGVAERKKVRNSFQDDKAYIVMLFNPVVFIYKNNTWFGRIIQGDKTTFRAAPSRTWPVNHGVVSWYKPPVLIKPPVMLQEKGKSLRVRLTKSVYSVGELVKVVNEQTKLVIKTDVRLNDIRLFITLGEWKLGDLLSDVATVAGLELRNLANNYFLTISRVHKVVSDDIKEITQVYADQKALLKSVAPFTQLPDFVNRVKPFLSERYLDSEPVDFLALSGTEQTFLKTLVDEGVLKEAKLRFVISASVGLVNPSLNDGSVAPVELTSESIVPYPLEAPLSPSKDSEFQSYFPGMFDSIGAKLEF